MRALALALLIATVSVARAWSQPDEPSRPSAPAVGGLFGGPEPGDQDEAYDARLRASAEAARGLAGPLDGGWTLTAENEGAIFALRFVDRKDRLEAVWRDLRRKDALNTMGAVEEVKRFGDKVTLAFHSRPGVSDFVSLAPARGGGYQGELTEGGKTLSVWLARNAL